MLRAVYFGSVCRSKCCRCRVEEITVWAYDAPTHDPQRVLERGGGLLRPRRPEPPAVWCWNQTERLRHTRFLRQQHLWRQQEVVASSPRSCDCSREVVSC